MSGCDGMHQSFPPITNTVCVCVSPLWCRPAWPSHCFWWFDCGACCTPPHCASHTHTTCAQWMLLSGTPFGFTLSTCLPLHQPLTLLFMIEKNDSQSLNNPGIVHCSNNSQTHSEGECEERKTHIENCHMSAVGSRIPFSRRTARSISMISDFCVVSFWSFSFSSNNLSRSCTTVLNV